VKRLELLSNGLGSTSITRAKATAILHSSSDLSIDFIPVSFVFVILNRQFIAADITNLSL